MPGQFSTFQGKVAIVTGAAGGIGGASAAELARHGAQVLLVDNRADAVQHVADELVSDGLDVAAFAADVTVPEQVEAYVEHAVERFGRLDLFHNNAALEGPFQPVQDYDIDVFDRFVAVNVRGVFLGIRAVLPRLLAQDSGAIVNTSSIASWVGFGNLAAYTATKHAVAGFTRAVAAEIATTNVRINAVSPGVIETEFVKRIERAVAAPDDAAQGGGLFLPSIPKQRYGQPEEIATVVRFLLSDDASYVLGANWLADGGMQATG
ncbi:SDR family NAD(P)-dependent oxidoreductase [Pseudonocardia sp. GCM10023141]|uniref:SDR family NAD(P)-dependent oxidoreductase n=1 Tax=Pseudonocardia sp. GCM10023141 TaxID=3252653 RepID=UPI003618593E